MAQKASTVQSANVFLNKVFKNMPSMQNPEMQVYLHWEKIIGEELSKEVELFRVDQGILLLKCLSAARKTELNFQKNAILNKANHVLGRDIIKGLRFI